MFGHQNDDDQDKKDGIAPLQKPQDDTAQNGAHPLTPHNKPEPPSNPSVIAPPHDGAPATPPAPAPQPDLDDDKTDKPAPPAGPNELLDIKQQALTQLSPLVDHLDQTPEEKFRTTMMMIQASDNQNLIKDAYDTAKKIHDEKARAQALLDIVNEINYFTQHDNSD